MNVLCSLSPTAHCFLCKDEFSGAKISWTCSPAFLVSFAVSDPLKLAQGPCPTIQKWSERAAFLCQLVGLVVVGKYYLRTSDFPPWRNCISSSALWGHRCDAKAEMQTEAVKLEVLQSGEASLRGRYGKYILYLHLLVRLAFQPLQFPSNSSLSVRNVHMFELSSS